LKSRKEKRRVSNNIIVILGVVIVGILVTIVLVLSNNPRGKSNHQVIGPDPSIPRGETTDGLFFLGEPDAPLTIIIYEDYSCPNCKRFFETVEPVLIEQYVRSGKLRLEIYPLAIVSFHSLPSAVAVYCAADQGYFWEFRQVVFLNQGLRAYNQDTISLYGDAVGLDVEQLLDCFSPSTYTEVIQNRSIAAQQFGVMGTPTIEFMGNRYPEPGTTELPDIISIVDLAIKEIDN
jgi:protein-disulfide isomerase